MKKKLDKNSDPLARERNLSGKRGVRRGPAGKVVSREAMEPRNIKVHISIKLDADVLEYFKERAAQPGGTPYQTQINKVLREAMERGPEEFPGASLLKSERFLSAITNRIRQRL
jgi:uncharacterized protein (DUF4415 family)